MPAHFPQLPGVKFFLHAGLLLAGALLMTGCNETRHGGAPSPQTSVVAVADSFPPFLSQAQPRLQTMKLFLGLKEVTAELALKPVEIYTGMMWRTNMADGDAMLFVFPNAAPRAFYMKNTLVPLSLAYIDSEGVILEIHDLQPLNENSVPSKADNVQYVLEVPQGWFTRQGIVPGTTIRTPHGELKRLFSFSPAPRP